MRILRIAASSPRHFRLLPELVATCATQDETCPMFNFQTSPNAAGVFLFNWRAAPAGARTIPAKVGQRPAFAAARRAKADQSELPAP